MQREHHQKRKGGHRAPLRRDARGGSRRPCWGLWAGTPATSWKCWPPSPRRTGNRCRPCWNSGSASAAFRKGWKTCISGHGSLPTAIGPKSPSPAGTTHIASILRDGESLLQDDSPCAAKKGPDKSLLSVEKILEFADTTPLDQVAPILERQIQMNSAIADEGLRHAYGAQVGRTILEVYGNGVKARAKARAAAGSDARMGGCPLPVVINSGSGNQGMTVSLPVIEFARELQVSHEKLLRALIVSNLVAVHQKKYIGSLSAYCGAVSAACGSGAAITYLYGGGYQEVAATITNTIANVGGIVCDGAKASCAAKIASAVDAAILGHFLGCRHCTFRPGEGLVQENVEETIENVGYIGRVGMKETDTEILRLMIDREDKLDEIHQMA